MKPIYRHVDCGCGTSIVIIFRRQCLATLVPIVEVEFFFVKHACIAQSNIVRATDPPSPYYTALQHIIFLCTGTWNFDWIGPIASAGTSSNSFKHLYLWPRANKILELFTYLLFALYWSHQLRNLLLVMQTSILDLVNRCRHWAIY